jgi:soluble lytic murein transglycosylase
VAFLLRGVIVYEIYPLDYTDEIKTYSDEYALDAYFVSAVIRTESGFDEEAVSHRGAVGLMQIMPDTGAWAAEKIGMTEFSADMLAQPDVNIRIGCWYLRYLDDMFEGDQNKVMAAYNAGPNKVKEWAGDDELGSIPYAETENYLVKVTRNYQIYKGLYDEF